METKSQQDALAGPARPEARDPQRRRARLSMLVSTLLVASSFPAVALAAGSLDSGILTLLRFGLAATLILPMVLLRHGRAVWPGWMGIARFALLSVPLVAFFALMFEALRTASPLSTSALFTLAPAFAALFAHLLLGERLRAGLGLALLTATAGALWVVSGGQPARLWQLELGSGELCFLVGTAALGLYSVLVRSLRRRVPVAVMTFWTLCAGAAWMLVLRWELVLSTDWVALEPVVWLAVAYLAVFATLCTFLLNQRAVTVIGPTQAMSFVYLNPALVALFSWLLGAGAPGWPVLPGVLLTLLAMFLLQLPARPGHTRPRPGLSSARWIRREGATP